MDSFTGKDTSDWEAGGFLQEHLRNQEGYKHAGLMCTQLFGPTLSISYQRVDGMERA